MLREPGGWIIPDSLFLQHYPRVESLVAEEPVEAAAPVVRAGLCDDVDDAARSAAELGDAAGSHHLKLADYVLTVVGARQVGGIVVRREAVNDEAVIQVTLPGDGEPLSGHGGRFRKALVAARVG